MSNENAVSNETQFDGNKVAEKVLFLRMLLNINDNILKSF